ncbi:MAG: AraC family transcriptional regulator [bacterium]|nr:AraC family transcriptional regulator [bacterium]
MANIVFDTSPERKILDLRSLGFPEVPAVGHYRYNSIHESLAEHSHGSLLEICYLVRGQQVYTVGDEEFTIKGGSVFMSFPREKHGTGLSPEGRGELYWIFVDSAWVNKQFLSLSPDDGKKFIEELLAIRPRAFTGGAVLKKSLERIFTAYADQDDPFRMANVQNWTLRFLLDLMAIARKHAQATAISPLIQRVQSYIEDHIEDHFEDAISLAGLSEMVHLSESRFKMRFKKEVGVPPADYINSRRIERAEKLLVATSAKITDVAMHLGFSSSQYFATVFKRYTGITPAQFQRSKGES